MGSEQRWIVDYFASLHLGNRRLLSVGRLTVNRCTITAPGYYLSE